jgi:hypothetical protein
MKDVDDFPGTSGCSGDCAMLRFSILFGIQVAESSSGSGVDNVERSGLKKLVITTNAGTPTGWIVVIQWG